MSTTPNSMSSPSALGSTRQRAQGRHPGFAARFGTLLKVMRRGKQQPDVMRLLRQRPALMFGVNVMELAQLASGGLDPRLKHLASVKASGLVGCPF